MEKTKKVICNEGGSRSSKTFSIFQFFLLKALSGERIRVTIARDKLTWVKETLLKDFQEITEMYNIEVSPSINSNRQEQVYMVNGSEFTFWGLDTPAKLHGKKQDWVWINEIMDVGQQEFDQLEMRTNIGIVLDYNPSDDSHWVFNLQLRPDVGIIRSTMLDNPFLPQTIIRKIRSFEPTPENISNGTADLYMWEVYGQGKKARLKGSIFTNWDMVDEVPGDAKYIGTGQDFGYSNDPTTLVDMWIFNNEIYYDEKLYQVGLTNDDIVKKYNIVGVRSSDLIVADSSEPKSIEEISRHGFNITAVEKGPDSVNYGIQLMKQYKIHITRRSINLEKEMRRYKWAEDRSGQPLKRDGKSVAIDEFNHAIDAARYITMTALKKQVEVKAYHRSILR